MQYFNWLYECQRASGESLASSKKESARVKQNMCSHNVVTEIMDGIGWVTKMSAVNFSRRIIAM